MASLEKEPLKTKRKSRKKKLKKLKEEPSALTRTIEAVSDNESIYPNIEEDEIAAYPALEMETSNSENLQEPLAEAEVTIENIPQESEVAPGDILDISCEDFTSSEVSLQKMNIEQDLKMCYWRKEQLDKNRQIVEEDFRIKTELLNVEITLNLNKLNSLEQNQAPTLTKNSIREVEVCDDVKFQIDEPNAVIENRKPSSPPLEPETHNLTESHKAMEQQNGLISSSVWFPQVAMPPVLTALGLHQISLLQCVAIRQLRSQDLDETYEVVEPAENLVIFRANVTVGLAGTTRTLRIVLVDNEVKEVATFQFCADRSMELTVCGQLVARVSRARTFVKQMLVLTDAFCRPVLKIKGTAMNGHKHIFNIQTVNKKKIGHIDKTPAQPSPHYETAHSILQFPFDLDERFKVALIACNFLIVDSNTTQKRAMRLRAAIASANFADQHQRHVHLNYPTGLHL